MQPAPHPTTATANNKIAIMWCIPFRSRPHIGHTHCSSIQFVSFWVGAGWVYLFYTFNSTPAAHNRCVQCSCCLCR